MSKTQMGNIPWIARELVDHLPKPMDDDLKHLIARAEAGQDTAVDIVNLFSKYEVPLRWLKEQLKTQGGEKGASSGEHVLAGNRTLIPPTQRWICPKNPDTHWFVVIQEGEDPPTCQHHNIEMVRKR